MIHSKRLSAHPKINCELLRLKHLRIFVLDQSRSFGERLKMFQEIIDIEDKISSNYYLQ